MSTAGKETSSPITPEDYLRTTPQDFPYEQQIAQILEFFDDLRTVGVMEDLEIRWPFTKPGAGEEDEGELRTPTRAELRAWITARLRERALAANDGHAAQGGFLVMRLRERLAIYFTPVYAEASALDDVMTITINLPGEVYQASADA